MKQKKKSLWTRIGTFVMSVAMLCGMFCLVPQSLAMLTANAATVSETESNDTMATAQAITIGSTINATLSESDYQDYFKVTLTTSGRLSFDITSYMPVLNFILYDEDANELYKRWEKYGVSHEYLGGGSAFQWNSISQKVSESISWDLTAGTYYFRFQFRKLDLDTGSYNFTTKFTSANETYKESGWGNNNTMQTANTTVFDKHYIGQIATNDEYDFYKVTLPSSGRLTTNISGAIEYLNCRLYDKDGTNLLQYWEGYHGGRPDGDYLNPGNSLHWNDLSKKIDCSFSVDLTKDTYYICLKRNKGNAYITGNYDISFNFKSANESFTETGWGINNTMADANKANLNTVYTGQIARNDDYDYYQIVMPKAGTLNTNVKGRLSYLNYRLYDEKGEIKESRWEKYHGGRPDGDYLDPGNSFHWNDTAKTFDETVSTELEAGTYYICLKKNGGDTYRTGTYDISFNSDVVVSPTSITLNKTSATIEQGKSLTLTATVAPTNATNKTVTWTTSNSSVATVSGGTVKAVGAGTATITAKTANGKTATCKVTVTAPTVDVTGITLNKTTASVTKGSSLTLTATIAPTDATNKTVTWTSSNTSVATVSGGVVKGVAAGTATITAASYNGKTAACKVTVTEQTVDVTGITLNKTTASVTKGSSLTLTATIAPSNATNKTVTWTTSNSAVATVSGGVVKGVAAGTATITAASYNGKTAVCKITVTENTTAFTLSDVKFSAYSINLGESITINCGAKNGTTPYQYAANYSLDGGTTTTIQAYSETAKIKFTPSKAGTYKVTVKAKDAANKEVSKSYDVVVTDKVYTLTGASGISASTIQLGDKILLTAKAKGGTGFYKYAFYQRKSGAEDWKTIRAYGAEPAEYFKPGSTGKYEILIKVKDSKGSIVKSTFTLTVKASDKKIHLSASFDKTTVYAGEAVYVKAMATGGTGYYKYGFYFKKATDSEWTTAKAFSASNEAAFTLPQTGAYQVCVKVKDSNGATTKNYYDVTSSINTTAIKNNSTVSATTITLGNTVKMTASCTGGTGCYEYSMLYRLSGETEWSIIQSFGRNTTVNFKPEASGKYELNIKITDSQGSQTEKYFNLTVN